MSKMEWTPLWHTQRGCRCPWSPGVWLPACLRQPLAWGPGLACPSGMAVCKAPWQLLPLPVPVALLPGETPGWLLPLGSQGCPEGWEATPRSRPLLGQSWGPQEKLLPSRFSTEKKFRALAQSTSLRGRLSCPPPPSWPLGGPGNGPALPPLPARPGQELLVVKSHIRGDWWLWASSRHTCAWPGPRGLDGPPGPC